MLKHFFPILQPPLLSNLLKSTCSTCSAFKIFQNIQNCNRHQSAQDAQATKVFFLSGFHLWFLAFCTNMPEEFVVRFPLAPCGFVRLCCMIRVLWIFFFKLTLLICFKKKSKNFRIFFPSVPRSCLGLCENECGPSAFLKENISQIQLVLAQGKHRLQTLI